MALIKSRGKPNPAGNRMATKSKVGAKAAMALKSIAGAADADEPVPATPGSLPPVQRALGRPSGSVVTGQGVAGGAMGATDGLGAGSGGLALHPSVRGLNIHGREPRHTSKTR